MINILYKPSFLSEYRHLPKALQEEVKEKIGFFLQNPSHPFLKIHKLKGKLTGRWSFSVNYKYRIVFRYESKNTALFLGIGDHDIYKA